MYSLLTCLIHAVYVIVTVYYHPIKSLNLHFNHWFDSKYLFMFYIISSAYHHRNIKKTVLIPWAGSHECYVNLNGRTRVMMHGHTQYAQSGRSLDECTQYMQSILCTHFMHHHACQAMHVHAYAFVSLLHTCCA